MNTAGHEYGFELVESAIAKRKPNMKAHGIITRLFLAVLGLALIVPATRAQFTTNFETNTISAVTSNWVGNGTYVVGSNTFLDTLIVQNGGVLSNGTGYVGYESSGSNNTAIVRDSGSVWTNQFDLYVGYMGAGNQLVISNGGQVFSTNAAIGSTFASASNNTAIVIGSNSLWSVAGLLNIGSNAANNTLVITNGGQVVDETAFVSTDAGGGYNVSALVTGTNSVWRNGPVLISVASPGNAITVADGAQFFSGGTVQIGRSAGASGNIVLVTDPGTT
jgi:T5SS/PEP-CTERM-associated repeat protein